MGKIRNIGVKSTLNWSFLLVLHILVGCEDENVVQNCIENCQDETTEEPGSTCDETCLSAEATCGTVCGEYCGTCELDSVCSLGACIEQVDCDDCGVSLSIMPQDASAHHREVMVEVHFHPLEGMTLPRMAEFFLLIEGEMALREAKAGEALREAGKDLYRDLVTGDAFKRVSEGTYRILAYGLSSAQSISGGQLATLRLEATGPGPIRLQLQRREQTFAPSSADHQLQLSAYDRPLTVKH